MSQSMDGREAWVVTTAALAVAAITLGAPYLISVAMTPIANDLGGLRAVPALAAALVYLGTGVGGLATGWLAERIGIRRTVIFGATMVMLGLALSSGGQVWQLYVGHGLLIGLLGSSAINAPLFVYVTRWFEHRRGTALALIASGQYLAGAVWPPIFERSIAAFGWQRTMIGYGLLVVVLVAPIAMVFLKPPPPLPASETRARSSTDGPPRVLGLPPNLTLAILAICAFLCCVPMSIPPAHLIAFCGDIGLSPARGAATLSLVLFCAFVSRQFWGWLSDRIGGLKTLLWSSAAQAVGVAGFLMTADEATLFGVATLFGLGYSGLIPAYVLTVRAVFPAREANWRVPIVLLFGLLGMATGSWTGGLLYDHFGFYAPAFALGLVANLLNFTLLFILLLTGRNAMRPVLAHA